MGDGIFNPYTKWNIGNKQKKLAVSYIVRFSDRRVLAFLFLHEDFTAKSLLGCVLIGAGTLVMVV